MKTDGLKKLNVPYIGIKVESIPTILNKVFVLENYPKFLEYYIQIGKSEKTTSEYLRSLYNLGLVNVEKENIQISSVGKFLLNDSYERFFLNLSNHLIKKYPDLKIVKTILASNNSISAKDLLIEIKNKGFSGVRIQTLSSYLKILRESGVFKQDKTRISKNKFKEKIEYNQFIKILLNFHRVNQFDRRKFELKDLYKFIEKQNKNYIIDKDIFAEFLQIAQRQNKIKLIEINQSVVTQEMFIIDLENHLFFYFEFV